MAEYPYLIKAATSQESSIAVRFSHYESIDTVNKFVGTIDWVWIDTVETLPISKEDWPVLDKFKKCLVCPERWGREYDIVNYKNILRDMDYSIDAVMTSLICAESWG